MSVFDEKNKKKKTFAFVDDNTTENSKDLKEFTSSAKGDKKSFTNLKGRPRLSEDKKKQKQIIVYLTQSEKDEIEKMASDMHLTTSQFIIMKIFQK